MADPTVRAVALPDPAIVSVAARPGGPDIATALGIPLPPPGKWHMAGTRRIVCTTPDQWLVVQADDDGTLFDWLADALGEAATLIDLSASHVAVRVSGPGARDALAKGVPIDLHPRATRPGDAASTIVAHMPVLLWQQDGTPTYDLLCARSLTGSFHRWLDLAGMPIIVTP